MRFDSGTASGSGQISNTRDKVLSIIFQARPDNTGAVYFGRSDVSATNGFTLTAGKMITLNFSDGEVQGSVEFSFFYATVVSPNLLDWVVVLA